MLWQGDVMNELVVCRSKPVLPVIDRARCEGKGDCVDVCPHDVFEVRRMEPEHFRALPIGAKLKSLAHGRKTAYTPRVDACLACGSCVKACPENAIQLVAKG